MMARSHPVESSMYVGVEECERMTTMVEAGISPEEIGKELDRHSSTVRRHARGRCKHRTTHPARECYPDNLSLVRDLRRLANALERVPSTCDWNGWDESPCTHSYIVDKFGGWADALESAGLAGVAPSSTEAIRTAVYANPELAETFCDE